MEEAGVEGELLLVGNVEPAIRPLLEPSDFGWRSGFYVRCWSPLQFSGYFRLWKRAVCRDTRPRVVAFQ